MRPAPVRLQGVSTPNSMFDTDSMIFQRSSVRKFPYFETSGKIAIDIQIIRPEEALYGNQG